MDNLSKDAFAAMIRDVGSRLSDDAIDEYWKAFETPEGRMAMLELYRSVDFEKLHAAAGIGAGLVDPMHETHAELTAG